MIPIFEQGRGQGIGYVLPEFIKRFDDICSKKDQSFAFIFYNFKDEEFRTVIKDEGVFAKLDRLSGENLHIFYLNSANPRTIERFNTHFMVAMGLRDVSPPCVVFFRRSKGGFTDVSAVPLDHTNLIHGFHELYEVIAKYNDRKLTPAPILKYLRWVPGAIKFISLETLRAALKLGLEVLLS